MHVHAYTETMCYACILCTRMYIPVLRIALLTNTRLEKLRMFHLVLDGCYSATMVLLAVSH